MSSAFVFISSHFLIGSSSGEVQMEKDLENLMGSTGNSDRLAPLLTRMNWRRKTMLEVLHLLT